MEQTDRWTVADDDSTLGLRDFLPALLDSNGVTTVELRTLLRGPSLQGRVSNARVLELAEESRIRSRIGDVTFWEAMMMAAVDEDPVVRNEIFKEALFHHGGNRGPQERVMEKAEFISTLHKEGFHESNERGITAITSRVRTSSAESHLALLDFRIAPSRSNTRIVTEMLDILDVTGFLISSGRSYHFYGARTLTAEQYWSFLGRAQLMAPFIDERWIAHQLISSKAALRVSTNTERHASPPQLVAWSRDQSPGLQ